MCMSCWWLFYSSNIRLSSHNYIFFFFESYNFEQLTGAYEILYITILKSQTYILRPQVPPERGVKLL